MLFRSGMPSTTACREVVVVVEDILVRGVNAAPREPAYTRAGMPSTMACRKVVVVVEDILVRGVKAARGAVVCSGRNALDHGLSERGVGGRGHSCPRGKGSIPEPSYTRAGMPSTMACRGVVVEDILVRGVDAAPREPAYARAGMPSTMACREVVLVGEDIPVRGVDAAPREPS